MNEPHPHLDGWIPYGAAWRDGRLETDWARLGSEPLKGGFFEDDVFRMLALPFNQLFSCRTSEAVLRERAERRPGLVPTGFIFHMSRCGSTLAARSLAALPGTMVLSEPSPIDAVLAGAARAPHLSPSALALRLQWMVAALGQPRRGDEDRLFVKFGSWHMPAWPLIRLAFPTTPWIFLYRDPVEVLVSQMRQASMHFVPGMSADQTFGLESPPDDPCMPREHYAAAVLAQICDAAIRHSPQGGGLLVDYRDLPGAFEAIVRHFGLTLTEQDRARIAGVGRTDAKRHGSPFSPDSHGKQAEASAAVREVAQGLLYPLHDALERLRLKACAG